jgi:hypothetical protein
VAQAIIDWPAITKYLDENQKKTNTASEGQSIETGRQAD